MINIRSNIIPAPTTNTPPNRTSVTMSKKGTTNRRMGTTSQAASETTRTVESAGGSNPRDLPYTLQLPFRFFLSTIVCVGLVAFGIGRLSATFAVLKLSRHGFETDEINNNRALPPPLYSNKKDIPVTVYSSKHYDSGSVSTTDTLLARRAHFGEASQWDASQTTQEVEPDGSISGQPAVGAAALYNATKMEALHEPSGHHLLVDIKSVNGKFLNSEVELAKAMIDLVELSGLTMLSYHCHRMQPVGVSCVGVLLESHISLHTWPIPGAICLDLFTCGPNSLLPILTAIERIFAVPRVPAVFGNIVEQPFVQWAYKLRGFRNEQPEKSDGDISQFLHGWLEFDMKESVTSIKTDYQTIEIYDIINPRFNSLHEYKKSLAKDESYAASNPELFRPDRVLYADGNMQSRFYGEAAYHEALVHPAMIAHPNPKRVAIIGGGEGATLREVLKHNTVETVTMIEIDERLVNISKQYLPEWSDCSMIVGSPISCFDDPRADIHFAEAVAWFVERFSDKDRVDPGELYDVIIMDALYVILHQLQRACFLHSDILFYSICSCVSFFFILVEGFLHRCTVTKLSSVH
jgi:S-adenosylmethionine decarboxylase proenzyme